jgi:DNA-directed RNA polymerase subunit beta
VGDKIGNRHGNKGVITKIVPQNEMPQLKDGRFVDICINPLGIISRMNVGQVFETNLAMSLNDIKIKLTKMISENKDQTEIKKYLLKYIKILDNTKENWYYKQFKSQLKDSVIDNDFIKTLSLIEPPFESSSIEKVLEAMKYTNTPSEYKLFDPVNKEFILNPICVGFLYFFRMVHIAEHKISARGISSYNRKTLQPTAGRKAHGGQRCGEMETNCLIGHGALKNLNEFMTTKSDCIDLKNQYIKSVIDSNYIKDETYLSSIPETVNLLKNYLLVAGLDMND